MKDLNRNWRMSKEPLFCNYRLIYRLDSILNIREHQN